MNADESVRREVLDATRHLLDAIAEHDWAAYEKLCDPSLSCFEPEAGGHLVEGLEFHRFYFDQEPEGEPGRTTISSPHIRVVGDVAVAAYNRLTQRVDPAGECRTTATQETRVWQRTAGQWRLVHFHRSTSDR